MDNQNFNMRSKLPEKLNIFCKLSVKLVFLGLLAIAYVFVPVSVAIAAPTPAQTYTSVVCYMRNGDDRTWQWGLNADNSWYRLYGRWERTGDTGIQRFLTDASKGDIYAACLNSRNYYNRGNYSFDGTYAADNSLQSNYPIFARDGIVDF